MELLTQDATQFGFNASLDPIGKDASVLTNNDPLKAPDASVPVTGGDVATEIPEMFGPPTPDANDLAAPANNTDLDVQTSNFVLGNVFGPIATIPGQLPINPGLDLITGEVKTIAPLSPIDASENLPLVQAVATSQADLSGDFFNVVQEPLDSGDHFDVTYRIQNLGPGVAGSSTVKFYLSKNDIISGLSPFDYELGSANIGSLGSNGGNTGNLTKTLTLPAAGDPFWNQVGDGQYYIGMKVDANNDVSETNESNNASTGEFKDFDGLRIGDTQVADLSGKFFNVVQEPLKAGESFNAQYNIQNTGPGKAANSAVKFYISNNSYISTADRFLGSAAVNSLTSGSNTGTLSKNLTLPGVGDSFWNTVKDGTYYIGMIADGNNQVSETNEFNNRNTGEFKDSDGVYIYNQLKQFTVNVDRVAQIDNLDPDPLFFTNRADFYSKVTIDGVQQTSPTVNGKDDVSPNWQFTQQAVGPVDIAIQLWDSDSGSADDRVDIDSRSGLRDVNITYDPLTGAITGDLNGTAGQQLFSQGAGDSDRGKMWFRVNHS